MYGHESVMRARLFLGWAVLCAAIIVFPSSTTTRTAHAVVDTIYVSNTSACPGNGSIGTPFCAIDTALIRVTGGPDTVFAVMGTGTAYREGIIIRAKEDSGTVNHPFILFARGAVTIDGGDIPPDDVPLPEGNRWIPRYAAPNSTLKLWAAHDSSAADLCTQVLMWSATLARHRRYPHDTTSSLVNLPLGTCHYFPPPTDSVVAHFEDPYHDYTQDGGYLSTRLCVEIKGSNVVLDGFTVLRSADDGIRLDGPSLRNVLIKNCTVMESANNGIDVNRAILSTVAANTCAYNSDHGIVFKTGSGPNPVADCTAQANTCYENDDDTAERGGINGIRIGSSGTPTTGHHLIEGNKTYRNEDTGIEVNRSYFNTMRYNQSWQNRDHGFDHLNARAIVHVGDLAYGNNRTGFSVEENALAIELHNCVMVDNGRETGRHDYELEVIRAARDSFVGDFNVFYRPGRAETPGCDHGEEADSILISWRHKDLQILDPCVMRCADVDSCFATVARFDSAGVNPNHNEAHSRDGNPKFLSGDNGDFRVKTSSPLVDAADTTVVGWRTTDVLGKERLDARTTTNSGKPAGAFAEIGPYEHDDGAPSIHTEIVGCTSLRVKWVARGESGDAPPAPDKYEVFMDDSLVKVDESPQAPGNWETETITGLEQYQIYSFKVRTTDEDGETAESNTAYGTPCCSPPCDIERPGQSRAMQAQEEDADTPLGLGSVVPNPSRGVSAATWSIPRAYAGAAYDLSLFDVAGRRVSAVASGTARAGRFTEQLLFHGRDGTRIPNGVLFLRLRVGGAILDRTIVLTR